MTSHRVPLNLPETPFRVRVRAGREEIWDGIRGRWLVLTPEEWVRRQTIGYLVSHRGVDPMLIRQEQPLTLYGTSRRADIVVYDARACPRLIVECKAPHIKLTQEVLEQVLRYNLTLNVPCILITNGLTHYCFRHDEAEKRLESLSDIVF